MNRQLLDWKIKKLKAERDSLEGQEAARRHKRWIFAKGLMSPITVASKLDRESAIDRKIRSAEALRDQLEGRPDTYLLEFDEEFANGDGKAAVALGDPGTAEHIGVLVPGINSAMGNLGRTLKDAGNLREEVRESVSADVADRTSTIVWMGYDSPNGLHDASNRAEAHQGAPSLKGFINDLRAGHVESPDSPHITVFGHSYGSTVTGRAALDGMKADDVVFLGSPGVGEFFVNAKDFPQQRIWAARPRTDFISWVAGSLGSDPSSKSFGAREIPLAASQKGHSDYYARGSRGLKNLAKVLAGRAKELE